MIIKKKKIYLILNILYLLIKVTSSFSIDYSDLSRIISNPAPWPDGIVLYHYSTNDYFTQEDKEMI